jgi:hypothetical protein
MGIWGDQGSLWGPRRTPGASVSRASGSWQRPPSAAGTGQPGVTHSGRSTARAPKRCVGGTRTRVPAGRGDRYCSLRQQRAGPIAAGHGPVRRGVATARPYATSQATSANPPHRRASHRSVARRSWRPPTPSKIPRLIRCSRPSRPSSSTSASAGSHHRHRHCSPVCDAGRVRACPRLKLKPQACAAARCRRKWTRAKVDA